MALNGSETVKKHRIEMTDRTSVSVTGVSDIISFDDTAVILETVGGILSVDGQDMHIVSMNVDSGEMLISGSVNGIIYPQSIGKRGGGLFRKRSK